MQVVVRCEAKVGHGFHPKRTQGWFVPLEAAPLEPHEQSGRPAPSAASISTGAVATANRGAHGLGVAVVRLELGGGQIRGLW